MPSQLIPLLTHAQGARTSNVTTLRVIAGAVVVDRYTGDSEDWACPPDVIFLDTPKFDTKNAPEGGVTCTQDDPEQEQICAHAERHSIPIRNSAWLAEVKLPDLR